MLKELLSTKKGGLSPVWVKLFNDGKRLEVLEQLIAETNYLPEDTPIKIRFYHLVNGPTIPKCICGKPVNFQVKQYARYCSVQCAGQDPTRKQQIEQTKLERYGNDYKEVLLAQTKKTNLERYGVEFPLQNETIRNKTGGFTDESRVKAKEKLIERFGVPSGNANLPETLRQELDANVSELHYNQEWSVTAIAEHYGVSCKAITSRLTNGVRRHCKSSLEIKALNYIKSIDPSIELITNDRTILNPKEIDLWIPSKQLGIELHGNYYHSQLNNVSKTLHVDKANLADSKGIRLIQLFESDMKGDKWKGIIRSAIGRNLKIHARKTEVRVIDRSTAATFLNEHHFQGAGITPTHAYGLFKGDQLLQVMTFGKSRYTEKYEWELLRNATKEGTTVVGGSSKLLSAFKRDCNPTSIISYCDRRLFSGEGYRLMGFQLSHHSTPGYHYFHTSDSTLKMYHRSHFQKHKLPNLLERYDAELTEWENMKINGWNRIYDCGTSVWIWEQQERS